MDGRRRRKKIEGCKDGKANVCVGGGREGCEAGSYSTHRWVSRRGWRRWRWKGGWMDGWATS